MNIRDQIACSNFPCADVIHEGYVIPDFEVDPLDVSVLMISESAPARREDYYYMDGDPLFHQTTLLAFKDAGLQVDRFQDILNLGIYLTSAVKCAKVDYGLQTSTIVECSKILENELALFPNLRVLMLMGDVAIKGLNAVARRNGLPRVIPPGSTYKIRGGDYRFRGIPVFPSYLQAGPSFFIEKSKRKMIAEDIRAAMRIRDEFVM